MEPQAIVDNFRRVVTKHYVDFEGRTDRREFWYYILAYVVLFVGVAIVQRLFFTRALTALLTLGLILPNLGLGVRRLHDINRSGWWILIGVVPGGLLFSSMLFAFFVGGLGLMLFTGSLLWLVSLAAAVLLIYWYAQPGTAGPNQYGPEPVPDAPAEPN